MVDRVGQQVGDYRLTRLLGQSSFAEVYLAKNAIWGTIAAIKVMWDIQVEEGNVGQYLQEAHLLAMLMHPHIVRVFDYDVDKGTPYLVMPYLSNGTLRTRHVRGTRLSLSTVVGYVQQIAQALQYAHDCGVLHRDFKPENMLIDEQGEILLSDFGIALIMQSQSTKDMVGAMAYMAPEQIQGHLSPASNQYSLGIVAYEWLCGTLPFHGSLDEIAVEHSVTPPAPLRTHLPTLSPDVERVILTALAKNAEERFASISDFATALEQASQEMNPGDERLRAPNMSSPPHIPSSSSSANILQQPVDLVIEHKEPSVPLTPFPVAELHTPPVLPIPEKKTNKPLLSSLFRVIKQQVLPSFTVAIQNITDWTFALVGDKNGKVPAPFRAVASIDLEEDGRAVVGKWYTIEAGIEPNRRGRFTRRRAFAILGMSPTNPVWFDLALITSDNIVEGETWHQLLRYDPRNFDRQLVHFSFRFATPGHGSVIVNFFHERGWFKCRRFEIDIIEQPAEDTATKIGGNGGCEL